MKFVVPEYKGENKGHYSPGVISNGLLFISGQLSIDPDTRKVPDGGIEEHTHLALDNLDRVLKEAGVSRSSVVQCRSSSPIQFMVLPNLLCRYMRGRPATAMSRASRCLPFRV